MVAQWIDVHFSQALSPYRSSGRDVLLGVKKPQ